MSETLPLYSWWDQVPDHLKTKTQLREQRLVPTGGVRAHIEYGNGHRYRCYDLYDASETRPVKEASPAQIDALERGRATQDEKRRTCTRCHTVMERTGLLDDKGVCVGCRVKAEAEWDAAARDESIRWARQWLAHTNWLLLDFETTDLGGYAVELAIVHPDGRILFNARLNPQVPIELGARAVHGISDENVRDCPTFAEVATQIYDIVRGHTVFAYNAEFDASVMRREGQRLGACGEWVKALEWRDVMEPWSAFIGEWSDYWQNYKWQPLGGAHDAASDCHLCLSVMQKMAATPLSTEVSSTGVEQ